MPGLSDKERKFIEAARREAAAKRGGAAPAPAAKTAAAKPAADRPAVAPAAASPLDGQTVIGWDHPAARDASAQKADGKWERIAALMEAERAEAIEKRRRAKRAAVIFLGALVVLVLLVAARVLLKR
jgi:hypothetical protein